MPTAESEPRWFDGLSASHWLVLAVASAGWVFDVYEGQLFTVFKTPMLKELTAGNPAVIEQQANLGLAAFLLGGAVGGLGFGMLGDRFGRARILALTILVYSVFSALTAFARDNRAGARTTVPGGAWERVANGRLRRRWWPRRSRPVPVRRPREYFTPRAFWAPHWPPGLG